MRSTYPYSITYIYIEYLVHKYALRQRKYMEIAHLMMIFNAFYENNIILCNRTDPKAMNNNRKKIKSIESPSIRHWIYSFVMYGSQSDVLSCVEILNLKRQENGRNAQRFVSPSPPTRILAFIGQCHHNIGWCPPYNIYYMCYNHYFNSLLHATCIAIDHHPLNHHT